MKKMIFGRVGKMVGVSILALIVLGPGGMAVVTAVGGLIGLAGRRRISVQKPQRLSAVASPSLSRPRRATRTRFVAGMRRKSESFFR